MVYMFYCAYISLGLDVAVAAVGLEVDLDYHNLSIPFGVLCCSVSGTHASHNYMSWLSPEPSLNLPFPIPTAKHKQEGCGVQRVVVRLAINSEVTLTGRSPRLCRNDMTHHGDFPSADGTWHSGVILQQRAGKGPINCVAQGGRR
jgi:hypothetical protein